MKIKIIILSVLTLFANLDNLVARVIEISPERLELTPTKKFLFLNDMKQFYSDYRCYQLLNRKIDLLSGSAEEVSSAEMLIKDFLDSNKDFHDIIDAIISTGYRNEINPFCEELASRRELGESEGENYLKEYTDEQTGKILLNSVFLEKLKKINEHSSYYRERYDFVIDNYIIASEGLEDFMNAWKGSEL